MSYIVEALGHLLRFIYSVVPNYGIAIIVFTVFVRLCLFPLYYKQTGSMLAMQELQPKMKIIQDKYKGKTSKEDKQKMQIEMSKLYSETGVNPLSGCLPLIIQLPIIWSLYRVLLQSSKYLTGIDYSFLGINLSKSPHSAGIVVMVLFPVLAGLTTFLSMKLFAAPQQQQEGAGEQVASMMKSMMYVFPLTTGFMAYTLPTGLGVYWITYNVFQIGQQYVLYQRFYKDKKQEKKDVKKSSNKTSK